MTCRIVEWEEGSSSLGRSVAAIGVFDGVHAGHRALIADTVALAHEHDALPVVVTFDRDPEQVVKPDADIPQLLTLEDKLDRIAALGVEAIVVIPFCMRLAEKTPARFLDDVLLQAVEPLAIAVGEDFRFGQHASGAVADLERFGRAHGFGVVAHELIERDGAPVTSTRIRALVAEGEVERACNLLGRPHRVPGTVVHGRGEGETVLGVPTANIMPWVHAALPRDGVYAGRVLFDDRAHAAAISVGLPPMFPDSIDRLEAHLLDFDRDLYGCEVIVEFERHLREQRVHADSAALTDAMRADIENVRTTIDPHHSTCGSEPPHA